MAQAVDQEANSERSEGRLWSVLRRANQALATRVKGLLAEAGNPIPFFVQRIREDNITRTAAALSFSSALALVPALALVLAFLAAFPAFSQLRADLQAAILNNMLPDTGLKMSETLNTFVAAAGRLTAFGVVGLIATAIFLLLTIEGAFNQIFRVIRRRRLLLRLLVLWTAITVGPMLVGVALSLFGYFSAAKVISAAPGGAALSLLLGSLMPTLLTWAAITFIYIIVPNRRVRFTDALIGGGLAAVAFALLRLIFAAYIAGMTSYRAIYGAVAALPVFLVWVFAVWMVVMAGAVITAALPDWRTARAGVGAGAEGRLVLALEVLARLAGSRKHGHGVPAESLAKSLTASDTALATVLDALRQGRFIVFTDDGRWVLSRDLDRTPLADLVHLFGLGLNLDAAANLKTGDLGKRLTQYLRNAAESERTLLSVSLARVVAPPEEGPSGAN